MKMYLMLFFLLATQFLVVNVYADYDFMGFKLGGSFMENLQRIDDAGVEVIKVYSDGSDRIIKAKNVPNKLPTKFMRDKSDYITKHYPSQQGWVQYNFTLNKNNELTLDHVSVDMRNFGSRFLTKEAYETILLSMQDKFGSENIYIKDPYKNTGITFYDWPHVFGKSYFIVLWKDNEGIEYKCMVTVGNESKYVYIDIFNTQTMKERKNLKEENKKAEAIKGISI